MTARGSTRKKADATPQVGLLYYQDEIRHLRHLLSNLPSTIPKGSTHDFTNYETNHEQMTEMGCDKSVLNRALEISFGSRANGQIMARPDLSTYSTEREDILPRALLQQDRPSYDVVIDRVRTPLSTASRAQR